MAVPIWSELDDLILDRVVANNPVDAPIDSTTLLRAFNDAYQDVYEIEGGGLKQVAHATAWSTAATSTGGFLSSLLVDVNEITAVWVSATQGSVGAPGDATVDIIEKSELDFLRGAQGLGTYSTIKACAVTRLATTTPASVNKVRLDFWPAVASLYMPIHYIPQFTPIDGTTITTPDLTDIGARDAALLAAARLAPQAGRPELVPSILSDISLRTQKALERKIKALLSGDQDR